MLNSEKPVDLYDVLGVASNASDDDIRQAYRKKAMEYHPDRNPNGEEQFKTIKAAYETLSDPDERAQYDARDQMPSMDDILRHYAARRQSQQTRAADTRGDDIEKRITLTLQEAYSGKAFLFDTPVAHSCNKCDGTGSRTKAAPTACIECSGQGTTMHSMGFFSVQAHCKMCHGAGTVVQDPCSGCGGSGAGIEKSEVFVPAGIDAHVKMRIQGKGALSRHSDGKPGDLIIIIDVKEDPNFKREGLNLFVSLEVPLTTAALGGSANLTMIDGNEIEVTIPEGSQSGKKLRVRGKGMPNYRSSDDSTGDLYIVLQVLTPTELTDEQKDIIRELDRTFSPENAHHPSMKTWVAKAKEWLC